MKKEDKIIIGSMIVLALICLTCAGIGAFAEGFTVKLLMWGLAFVCFLLFVTLHAVGGTIDSKESSQEPNVRFRK